MSDVLDDIRRRREERGALRRALSPREIVREGLGYDPTIQRGDFLPTGRTASGEATWAVPQMVIDALEAFVTPGAVARGYEPSVADAMNVAANVAGGGFAASATLPIEAGSLAMNAARKAPDVSRISTRLPGTKNPADDPLDMSLTIDVDAARRTPKSYEHNVQRLTEIPGLRKLQSAKDPKEIEQVVRKHFSDNLDFLIRLTPDLLRERNKRWYEGANRFANALAARHKVTPEATSAVIAALSPQKDWFQNASLAERLSDIALGKADTLMTGEMKKTAARILGTKGEKGELVRRIEGKTLSDLTDPVERAAWIRTYDETFNPRHYRELTPTGEIGDFITTKGGDPRKVAWGSLGEIAKGDQALMSGGDPLVISGLMGEKHKVRNFYNNIIDPFSPYGDVTSDTHQVAANALMPYSGASGPVHHNFGSSPEIKKQPEGWVPAKSSNATGVKGTYPFHAEAVRDAAAKAGILPREAQSISWEAVREIFSDVFKRNPKNHRIIDDIWTDYENGGINADEARKRIVDAAGGYSPAGASRSGGAVYDPSESSTY